MVEYSVKTAREIDLADKDKNHNTKKVWRIWDVVTRFWLAELASAPRLAD